MSGMTDSHPHVQRDASDDVDVVYLGYRRRGRAIVEKRPSQEQLTPERSLGVMNHSPSGFSWGYAGSGPAQLVLALLLDYTDDEEVALAGVHVLQDRSREPAGVHRVRRLLASHRT